MNQPGNQSDPRWLDPERPRTGQGVQRPAAPWHNGLHALGVVLGFGGRLIRNLIPGRLQCEQWQGTEPASGAPLRVLYLGSGENRAHLHQLLFDQAPPAPPRPACHWLWAKAALRRLSPRVELVLLDLAPPLQWLLGGGSGLRVPAWIKQKVAIADSWEAVVAGLRRKTRREVKRMINKHGFRARIVPGAQAGPHFYRALYRPYIEQRYQQGATLVSERRFLRECRHGEVIELLQGERVVGAALLRLGGSELSVVWTGIAPDLGQEERGGVTDALDFFSLLYAFEQGCSHFSLGGSRADLQDGLLRYKRKWGARLELGKVPGSMLTIAPQCDSAGVRGFLQRHSFITVEGDGALVGNIWLGQETPDEETLQSLTERFWNEGLNRCELLVTAAVAALPANPQLQIRSLQGDWRAAFQRQRPAQPG